MQGKFQRLWKTKNKNDEWWSSFVTSPIAIAINLVVVDWPFLTPNRITVLSFVTGLMAGVLILLGEPVHFIIAAFLINLSHVLDCMDGQMAKYRGTSSRFGNYFDKVTDQIKIFVWFAATSVASFNQTHSVTPVLLGFTGVCFYYLRVYVKYVTIFIEIEHDKNYLENSSAASVIVLKEEEQAGPGAGFVKNLLWFVREQRKLFLFNEAVFVFMISLALILNQLLPMLWIFALSQLYYGTLRAWQRGRQIYLNQHSELLKPMEK
jgi:phosphatidylglycerophosphate synthase